MRAMITMQIASRADGRRPEELAELVRFLAGDREQRTAPATAWPVSGGYA